MEKEELIRLELICASYEVEPTFIDALVSFGLLEVDIIEDTKFVEKKKIRDLEKMMRLHYDLEINMEGIDTISHLLVRVHQLQNEVTELRNRLRFYENL